jgi:hypothetical protein
MERSRRGQAAIEFILLVGVTLMILGVFLIFIRQNLKTDIEEQDFFLVKDLVGSVRGEVLLASSVSDGYERTFVLPTTLDYHNYSVYIMKRNSSNNTYYFVWASTNKSEYLAEVPAVVGNVTRGNNTIKKIGGVVYLNT